MDRTEGNAVICAYAEGGAEITSLLCISHAVKISEIVRRGVGEGSLKRAGVVEGCNQHAAISKGHNAAVTVVKCGINERRGGSIGLSLVLAI